MGGVWQRVADWIRAWPTRSIGLRFAVMFPMLAIPMWIAMLASFPLGLGILLAELALFAAPGIEGWARKRAGGPGVE